MMQQKENQPWCPKAGFDLWNGTAVHETANNISDKLIEIVKKQWRDFEDKKIEVEQDEKYQVG